MLKCLLVCNFKHLIFSYVFPRYQVLYGQICSWTETSGRDSCCWLCYLNSSNLASVNINSVGANYLHMCCVTLAQRYLECFAGLSGCRSNKHFGLWLLIKLICRWKINGEVSDKSAVASWSWMSYLVRLLQQV